MKKRSSTIRFTLFAIMAIVLVASSIFVYRLNNKPQNKPTDTPIKAESTTESTTKPQAPIKTSTATIGSSGDILIHVNVYEAARTSTGSYDFNDIFTYVKKEINSCDYFIANLETTLAGTENGRKYSGFPCFNSPDSIIDAVKNAGIDCLLTANNHTYDTGYHGVIRTQNMIENAGLDHFGTRPDTNSKKYFIKNVNDINFGMVCYTYETVTKENRKALNGLLVSEECAPLINSFEYNKLPQFYAELEEQISAMKNEGAEVIVVYLHWGNEYQIQQDVHQEQIAQKLCDMGVDVIIGGHPHVVQPVDLITSTDGNHKTVCIYSLGNMVSNQRRAYMGLKTGHTEDGVIFKMTFSKYSDGSVSFDNVEAVPTWVHMYTSSKKTYNVVPLNSDFKNNPSNFGLNKSSNGLDLAGGSYDRTNALVNAGVKECNDYLQSVPKPDTKFENAA